MKDVRILAIQSIPMLRTMHFDFDVDNPVCYTRLGYSDSQGIMVTCLQCKATPM